MISGYSKRLQDIFKNKSISIGQRIVIEKDAEIYEGFLMPARSTDHIVIKLDNGYNIGVHFTEGTIITKKSEFREPRKVQTIIEKHKPDKAKPTITLISTGGTVASRIDYKTGAVTTAFTPEELYMTVPELKSIANFRVHQLFQMFSQDMEPEHWLLLARTIKEHIENGADGVIITHGTDIMHYTAAALALMLRDLPVPVLLIGAQRSSDRGSSDAFSNMICAARFAAKGDYGGVGICMHATSDDEFCFVLDPVNVRKMHTSRRDAFRPIDVKPIAKIHIDGEMEYLRKDALKRDKSRKIKEDAVFCKDITIIKSRPGFSFRELELYEKSGFKGIVIEATGLGHLPNEEHDEYTKEHTKINTTLKRMTKSGIVVVMASQCAYGRVNLDVYSPQRALTEAGVLPVRMTAETAFVKLGWLLGQTKDAKKVKEMMNINYAGEIVDKIDNETFLY